MMGQSVSRVGRQGMAAAAAAVAPVPAQQGEPLANLYERHFTVIAADTPALKREVYGLRYQVLAEENAYLAPEDYPDRQEWDEYDARAEHYLLVHRPTDMIAGTVRLIVPDAAHPGDELQMIHHCEAPDLHARMPVMKTGEVSRFAVSRAFRRRLTDGMVPDIYDPRMGDQANSDEVRRLVPYITIGLLQGTFQAVVKHRLTHVCSVMEPTLVRLLQRFGIYFDTLGPLVPLYGWRQPCVRGCVDLLEGVRQVRPDVYEILSDHGRLARQLLSYGH